MKITDNTWDSIVAWTRAAVERHNAYLAAEGVPNQLTVALLTVNDSDFTLLTTRHEGGWRHEAKAVARESRTGELRACRMARDSARIKGVDPKSWARLADKPAEQIAPKLGLLDYLIPLRSNTAATSSSTIYRGFFISETPDGFVAKKDDVMGGPFPSEDDACNWINPRADEAIDAAVAQRRGGA